MKNEKSNMSGSKLTGQEISTYFRKNPKAKAVKKAVEIALDHGGAMTYAIKQIEKMKRGLSNHPEVKKALRYANESVHHESLNTMYNIISENYTRNFESLCSSLKLNGIQQKILDDFIHKGRIRDQYVGRVAGTKKEKRIYAGKKKFTGSIENRNEALVKALKVNAKQKSILDAYLKTGKVVGKYTGSIAGSTKPTKSYAGFKGFKEHFESTPEAWELIEGLDVRRSKNFKNYDRKGHEARLYDLEKTTVKDIDNAIKKARGKAHISSFEGDSGKPKDFEIMGDMKTLQQISKILKQGKVTKNPYKESVDEGIKSVEMPAKSVKDAEELAKKKYGRKLKSVEYFTTHPNYKKDKTPLFKVTYKEDVDEAKHISRNDLMRKHGREFKKVSKSNNFDLSSKAEDELIQYVLDNYPEELKTDDPDDWLEWLEDNFDDFVKGKGYK